MTKFLSDIILSVANDIQFQTTAGANAGKISQVGDDLVLSNAVGDILLGNGSDDIFIGDGTNTVDIRFEQNMAIFADSSSTRTLTLGGSNTNLVLESPTLNSATFGATTINNKLTFTTTNGYIVFDHEPTGDTDEYTTEVPLLKVDIAGTERTILSRVSQLGAVQLGHDDMVLITAGDVGDTLKTELNTIAETVVFAAESGFHAYGFPNNDTTWANRNEFRFRSDSTTASQNGLYIGDGSATQFIDLSRNLVNIGTIASSTITTTELTTAGQGDISTGTSYQQGSVSAFQPKIKSSLLAHSPEDNTAVIHPYFFNDLANFVARGGTVTYGGLSANPTSDETARMFEPSARTANASQAEITGSTWTIALTDFPRSLNYGARFGISFGATSFSPSSMLIEYSTDNGASYTTALNSSVASTFYHTYIANGGTGINAVKFTLGKRSGNNGPRVMNIYAYNYDSRGMTEYFVDKGGDTLYGNLSVGSNSLTAGSLDINGNADISGNLTGLDNITSTNFIIGGHTINDVDQAGQFNDVDDHLMSSAAIQDKILSYNYTTNTGDYVQGNNLSAGNINFTGELNFTGSGSKYIDVFTLANSNDFTIRHHNETGNLFENAFKSTANGATYLYHDGSTKLTTKSDGVDITGELQCDTLDVDGNADISGTLNVSDPVTITGPAAASTNGILDIRDDSGNTSLRFGGNSTYSWIQSHSSKPLKINELGNNVSFGTGTASFAGNLTVSGNLTATTQSASNNSTKVATTAYVDTAVANLVDSAPENLNTLNELAEALNDDDDAIVTLTNSIANNTNNITSNNTVANAALPKAGGTMSGDIAMGSNNITGGGTITGTTLTGTSLDINGNADISGNLSGLNQLTSESVIIDGGSGNVNLYARSTGTVSYIQIHNSSTGNNGTNDGLTIGNNGTAAYVWNRENAALYLGTNDTAALTIDGSQNATFAGTINSGAITSTGQITGTELEGTSLDINGNADISGNLVLGSYTVASQGDQSVFGKLSSFQSSGSTNLLLGVKNGSYPNRGWSFDPVLTGVNCNLIIKEHGSTAERIKISTGGNFEVLTGSVTATGLDINGNADIAGNLTFSGAARDILIVDNDATALEIKEGSNLYARFNTTNGAENILLQKATSLSSTLNVDGNATFTADVFVHHDDGLQIGDTGNNSTARTTLTSFNGSGNSRMKIKGGNFVHSTRFETSKNDFQYAEINSSYNGSDSTFNLYKSNSDTTGTAATTTISTGTSTFAGSVVTPTVIVDNVTAKTSSGNITFKNNGGSTIAQYGNDLNATFAGTINSGAITSTGKITGTELEGTSLDINGNADISGTLDMHDEIVSYASNALFRKKNDSWSNATTHDLLYQGWYSNTGDYVYLKSPGNSTNDHGIAFIGDDVIALGRSDVETGNIDNNSATAPLSENWFVLNSSSATFAGSVIADTIVINDTDSTRGVFRNDNAYDLRLGGGTVYSSGAYISLGGGLRGGGTSNLKGRLEMYSGGSNFSAQADITGDIVMGAQWNGGSSNILTLDSSTNNATFAGMVTAPNLEAQTAVYSGGIVYGSTILELKNNTGTKFLDFNSSLNATFAGNVTAGAFVYSERFRTTVAGTESFAAIYMNSDSNSGLFQPAADSLGFTTAGTTALTLDSSQNATFAGNVTIPQYIYHDSDGDTAFGFATDDTFRVITGTTTRLDIAAGIELTGNTTLTGNLTITGTVDGVDIAARDGVLSSTATTADAALPKTGGTMEGALALAADPTNDLHAATKQYVDEQVAAGGGNSFTDINVAGNIIHTGNTNTKITFGTDTITLGTAGNAQLELYADDVGIKDNLQMTSSSAQIQFTAHAGGNNEGITYKDSSGAFRYAMLFPGSNKVAITNRAANGKVEIRTNSSTAGATGEGVTAEFASDKIDFRKPIQLTATSTPSNPASGRAIIYMDQDDFSIKVKITGEEATVTRTIANYEG